MELLVCLLVVTHLRSYHEQGNRLDGDIGAEEPNSTERVVNVKNSTLHISPRYRLMRVLTQLARALVKASTKHTPLLSKAIRPIAIIFSRSFKNLHVSGFFGRRSGARAPTIMVIRPSKKKMFLHVC